MEIVLCLLAQQLTLEVCDHTQWHVTICRAPLDEWSARCRDLYLATHNTQKRQTSMPPAGFEPAIPASERPQTLALDRLATFFFIILLFSLCTLFVLVSLSGLFWLCLLSLLYNTLNTNIHVPGGIRTRNPNWRTATDLHPKPRVHWDRLSGICRKLTINITNNARHQ